MSTQKGKTSLGDFDLVMDQSPHIFEKWSSQWIMLQVIIAMLFPLAAGTYFFGMQTLWITCIAVLTCVISEYVYERIVRKRMTINDLSAVVTGMVIGLSMPNGVSWFSTVLASLFAIVIVKMIPGGIGKNRFNPAVASRIMYLMAPWIVNSFVQGPDILTTASSAEAITTATPTDLVATATPLFYISSGATEVPEGAQTLWNMFLGNQGGWGGSLGETSSIALLIAMAFLIFRRIINPKVPALYIGTVALIMLAYSGFDFEFMMYHILSGALLLGGTFMVTDYASGGLTPFGRMLFPIGAGILTAAFRISAFSPEGVGFSILIMNAIIPFLDKLVMPRIYGHKKRPMVHPDYDLTEPLNKRDILAEK
ncbi:RnfABCDGE type electron transport complex subunit D [Alkalibacterium sp. MB6]|uniref:RnfABCDGE type electron transport complex subunit D n=1 Tax=Alkalibacterium sp. MB6 TaxID=2081965 RepID=UPI00137B673D|nr:RnfABCDGE type electron transport complex subunit D [Alkalibacterium sp. MB6]